MAKTSITERMLEAMRFRCIGPPRGGRVVAVAGDPHEPAVFYFGAVAGGIWKTEDAGTTWVNVSDGYLKTSSVGALAVSDADPSVIYAGMGESTIRSDVSHGDGVYKSTDAGRSWMHVGLADSRHISEIRIHPRDPDRVYVAALGHAYGPHPDRGVFRSTDGGANWQRVLYRDERAGAADLSLDPRNPTILYASLWEAHRNFYELASGGPGSGLWKSTDGGDTWSDITANIALPANATLGKIGVTASPVRAGRVWALIESDAQPGLYRSEDFGVTWTLATDRQDLRYRPWYYMHVFADPQDEDTVYVNNLDMWKSTDAGATFTQLTTPHGDNHDLWIDPRDNRRMVQSNDGGANVSFNAGRSWSTIYNQLTAQFYTVTTDGGAPFYRVYGTQQDNSSVGVPSSTIDGAIVWADCRVAGTGESGYMAVHPRDPDIVYVGAVGSSPGGSGALQRYDHRTGQVQLVNVWPEHHGGLGPGELKYRFPWTFPILFSPHDPDVLYTAGNVVFRSTDEGHSWEPISPDLTRNAMDKLGPSGGPITFDTSGAEHYCTLYALAESPHEAGVMWAGSDDGLVHLTRDAGGSWQDVTPPDLPEWAFIRTVEPSPHAPGSLYLAATRYKHDDPTPYLYKTSDYGESWQSIVGSGDLAIPADDFTRVIRADPKCPGVLYAGTETGLYVSLDDGAAWRRWGSNFPVTPVYDLKVEGSDLAIATHGRSFWILDDLTPLHQGLTETANNETRLFAPRPTWRLLPDVMGFITGSDGKDYSIGLSKAATYVASRDEAGQVTRNFLDAGEAAPLGAVVYYHLAEKTMCDQPASLSFHDANGNLIREFRPKPPGHDKLAEDERALDPGPWMPMQAGANRFVWDLRYPGAMRILGNKTGGEADRGPLVLPGTYEVRLTVAEQALTAQFEVLNDPRSPASHEDLEEQLSCILQMRDKISALYQAVQNLRHVTGEVERWCERLDRRGRRGRTGELDETAVAGRALCNALAAVETVLIRPGPHTDTFGLHDRVRLNAALASVISILDSADARPTVQARALAGEYMAAIDAELARLDDLIDEDLAAFNEQLAQETLPAIERTRRG